MSSATSMESSELPIFCKLLLPLLLSCCCVGQVWAGESAEADAPGFSLHGFGTLGMARSSSDQADFVRDLSQPDGSRGQWTGKVDSLLGVQANYRFSEKLEGVAQAVSRYRYDRSFRPEVGWAFLKYDLNPSLSLRAGRIGMELYMLADSRLIGYSYLPVRPPTDYFSPLALYYFDGGDVTLTVPVGSGLAKFKAFYGLAGEKIPVAGWAWDLAGSPVLGGYVDYLSGAWRWRLSYAQLRFGNDFPVNEVRGGLRLTGVPSAVAAADALSVVDRRAHYYSAAAEYDKGPFRVQLMLSRTTQESAIFEEADAGYGLLAYRFSALTPYFGFSRARSSAKHLATGLPDAIPPFAALNAGVATIMRQSHVDQRTFFAGVRWDVQPNVALKIQWDRLRGESGSVMFQQRESQAWNGRTNVLSLTLDFVF